MHNTCPSPGCRATYELATGDLARRFSCNQCGASLVVTNAGLALMGTSTTPLVAPILAEGTGFSPLAQDKKWQALEGRLREDLPAIAHHVGLSGPSEAIVQFVLERCRTKLEGRRV